ncbi:MAG: DNA alkylation repair protein [Candidatus Proteinoplasmatales archaeon SG8-5]|nr:MAG: DNA alkylation repair protein [Candidatus Proteinoplasmatales archaeon SG8-5]
MNCNNIIKKIKSLHNPKAVEGMARYGINPESNYGVKVSTLREMAKEIGKDHELALELWDSGIHDARILAPLIEDKALVTENQMDRWVSVLDSWDICDNACALFTSTEWAYEKAVEWSRSDEEFVKRAGYVMMARLAVRDKKADNSTFEAFFPHIRRGATDERNYVKKAVNWAVRSIGKRNLALRKRALELAREIKNIDSKAARWIANDAIRELENIKTIEAVRRKDCGGKE